MLCAYCFTDRPALEARFLFANGSRICCDLCWLRANCGAWWWRWFGGPIG